MKVQLKILARKIMVGFERQQRVKFRARQIVTHEESLVRGAFELWEKSTKRAWAAIDRYEKVDRERAWEEWGGDPAWWGWKG